MCGDCEKEDGETGVVAADDADEDDQSQQSALKRPALPRLVDQVIKLCHCSEWWIAVQQLVVGSSSAVGGG